MSAKNVQLQMVASQLNVERAALKRELLSYLKGMALEIENALADVEADNTINSNLMQHATSVAERVGRWNLSRILTPYLKEES